MASTTQPTIVWKQYKLATTDNSLVVGELNGNTVDYQAVQAGQYSPAICVRPQFSQTDSTSGAIGSVRLWWSTTNATHLGTDTNVDLPSHKWVLKYYVTDCSVSLLGDESTTLSATKRCAKMLSYLSSSERVAVVATDRTFKSSAFQSNTTAYAWCKSVWQGSSDGNNVSMQPVPFTGYEDTIEKHEEKYAGKYGATWLSTVFGIASDAGYTKGQLMDYAAGGVLTSTYKCNVKGYVTSNDNSENASGFPYIFFTIKAPTDAAAGTWSGWACRISYIWPYTATTTSTTT